jgi:hypothetical protein
MGRRIVIAHLRGRTHGISGPTLDHSAMLPEFDSICLGRDIYE